VREEVPLLDMIQVAPIAGLEAGDGKGVMSHLIPRKNMTCPFQDRPCSYITNLLSYMNYLAGSAAIAASSRALA